MKKIIRILCLLAVVLLPLSLWADAPKQIVESVVSDMKKQKSPIPILEHVHWPTAYNSFPAEERKAMGVNSPDELKSHMMSVMSDPSAFMKKQMKSRLKGVPPEQQKMMNQMMAGMMSQVDSQVKEMKDKIGRAQYQIGEERINGNSAQVDITATMDGKVKNTTVDMKKIEGQWYFPTIDFASQNAAKGIG